jgi:hypothetical protein
MDRIDTPSDCEAREIGPIARRIVEETLGFSLTDEALAKLIEEETDH